MRLPVVAAAALALTLGACGGGDDRGPTDPLSKESARKALITSDDMPYSWKIDLDSGVAFKGAVTKGPAECNEVLDQKITAPVVQKAAFKASDAGPFFAETITSFQGAGATQDFDTGVERLSRCTAFTVENKDGRSLKMRVEKVGEPDLGDRAVEYNIGGRVEGVSFRMNLVVAQVGQTVVGVTRYAIEDEMPQARFTALAELAVERVVAQS